MSETLSAGKTRGTLGRLLGNRDAVLVAVLLLVIVVASILLPRFATTVTVGYLLLEAIPILLIALPMTLIIITGEIDLSVASIVGLSVAVVGTLTMNGVDFGTAAALAMLAGILAGALNGVLIAFVGLPSLAVTIGTLALFRGLALVFIGDNQVAGFPPELSEFVRSRIGSTGIPTVMIFVVVIIAIFAIVLHLTPFGRALYALGYSKEAATFVGVKVALAKFWLYIASGVVCGFVAIYLVLVNTSASSDKGAGLELTVIAAVLLGGISIFGGRGTILGALTGVLIISSITYALRLPRVPNEILIIITGSLLIISVIGPSVFAAIRQRQFSRRVQRTLPRA